MLIFARGSASRHIEGWPEEEVEIQYAAAADNSQQPDYARWCIQNDWYFIHPHFRGPRWTPTALGSDLVVQDVVSAVHHMTQTCQVDTKRIYLIGGSGGGHAALLMAGRRPDIWAGVSAWCGIADIRRWWEERTAAGSYMRQIEQACGGCPDTNARAAEAIQFPALPSSARKPRGS